MGKRHPLHALAIAALLCGCAKGEDTWDISIDYHPDTGGGDTGWDPGWDTGLDPGPDTGLDTGIDTGHDTSVDPGTDTGCPSPCGLVPQCGCPTGQKCSLTGDPPVRGCVTAGTGTKGVSCLTDDDCAAGFICVGLFTNEGASEAACYPFCASEVQCPGDASVCFAAFSGTTDSICSLGCNLITNSGCPSGSKCTVLTITSTGQAITDCTADSGYGTAGSSCSVESDCGPGTFCETTTLYECLGFCTVSPTDSCPSWGCESFSTPAIFDGIEYGYCY